MKRKVLPVVCPSCEGVLTIRRLECCACTTAVEGRFALPVLARLNPEEQAFITNFVKCSGSLKELARLYGVSYPTVRNRLDTVIERVGVLAAEKAGEEG